MADIFITCLEAKSESGGKYPLVNYQGMIAFFIPALLTFASFYVDALKWFYSYGWFTGSIVGGLIYYGLKFKDRV